MVDCCGWFLMFGLYGSITAGLVCFVGVVVSLVVLLGCAFAYFWICLVGMVLRW